MSKEYTFLGFSMPRWTIALGLVLIGWGCCAYGLSNRVSWTPMIPAVFGLFLGALGSLSLFDSSRRHHYMHTTMVVALLCILGGGRVVVKFAAMSALAIGSHVLLLLSGMYLLVGGVLSFRAARLANATQEEVL